MQDKIKIHVMKCGEVGVDPAVTERGVWCNPPGPVYDKAQMSDALMWVRQMEETGTLILASHDPEILEQTIEL